MFEWRFINSFNDLFLHIKVLHTSLKEIYTDCYTMNVFTYHFKRNKYVVAILFLGLLMSGIKRVNAQFVQIESILVDACDGTVEGKNEMVSFRVESLPVNVADIRVDGSINGGSFQTSKWPNTSNSFLGWIVPGTAAYGGDRSRSLP